MLFVSFLLVSLLLLFLLVGARPFPFELLSVLGTLSIWSFPCRPPSLILSLFASCIPSRRSSRPRVVTSKQKTSCAQSSSLTRSEKVSVLFVSSLTSCLAQLLFLRRRLRQFGLLSRLLVTLVDNLLPHQQMVCPLWLSNETLKRSNASRVLVQKAFSRFLNYLSPSENTI